MFLSPFIYRLMWQLAKYPGWIHRSSPPRPDSPTQLQIKRPSPDAVLTHPRDIKAKNMPSQLAGCSHIVSRPTKIWVCWNQLLFRGILNSLKVSYWKSMTHLLKEYISKKKHNVIMSHMTQDINQSWSKLSNSIILSWWTWILRALPFIPLRNALPVLILIGGSLTEINDCADLWKYCWSKAHCFVAHWYGALCHRCEGLSIHQKSFWLFHLQWQGQEKITLRFTILKVASRMLERDNSTFTWMKSKLNFYTSA